MITLKAKEGYKYTQAEDVNIEERIFATELCLGKFDKEENWKLIPDQEVEEKRIMQIKAIEDRQKINIPE